ncbi:MAG: hypothetical protein WCT04_12395 [Planctomycetota bacterium]
MNIQHVLQTLSRNKVESLLIGGMAYLLNHNGPLTYDMDFFVRDTPDNLSRLNTALRELECEWGPKEAFWKPVAETPEWLTWQPVYCLTSPHGAIDLYRAVKGLEGGFDACFSRAILRPISDDDAFFCLSDDDMLRCQEALPEEQRRLNRVHVLKEAINRRQRVESLKA